LSEKELACFSIGRFNYIFKKNNSYQFIDKIFYYQLKKTRKNMTEKQVCNTLIYNTIDINEYPIEKM
jgi:hypothetical protein